MLRGRGSKHKVKLNYEFMKIKGEWKEYFQLSTTGFTMFGFLIRSIYIYISL